MTDVRTLWIEKDWFEIAQRWSTLIFANQQIYSSAGVEGVCAAAEPAPTAQILRCTCGKTFWHPGDLRHWHFQVVVDNIWIVGAWSPSPFTVLVEGSSIGTEISLGIHISARQHNPDPLYSYFIQGLPRLGYCNHRGMGSYTGYRSHPQGNSS